MSDKRSLILQKSLELFASRGYDAVGVQQIVESAGLTKPTLYHYFGSKRGLLEALLREQFSPFLQDLQEASAYTGDLPLCLQRVIGLYFRFSSASPTLYRMHLALWFANPDNEAAEVISPFILEQHQLLENMFQQASARHGNMKGRQQVYAASLLGMINSYIVQAFRQRIELNEPIIHQAVQQFSHGIYS